MRLGGSKGMGRWPNITELMSGSTTSAGRRENLFFFLPLQKFVLDFERQQNACQITKRGREMLN